MTRRTRIEYATTHTMSEARRRLSSTACSLMAGPPWGRNAWVPHSACHRMDGQVLGADLNCSESGRPAFTFRLYRRPADGPTVQGALSDRGAVRTGRRVTPSPRGC